jgi:prepilin-type N-terminal cleavage/methylation domain-containing protein
MVQRRNRPAMSLAHPVRSAFTIIELLVVIAIIAILIALVIVVAHRVAGSGKMRLTESTLKILDTALEQYIAVKGNPPPVVADPRQGGASHLIPVADARDVTNSTQGTMINSVGLFMLQCKEVPEAFGQFSKADSKLVHDFDPDQADPNPASPNFAQQPSLQTAFDGWGNPIRYVHPVFKGKVTGTSANNGVDVVTLLGNPPPGKSYGIVTIRRSNSQGDMDADGGLPPSNRPYFYSAGPDGDASTTEDNVYLVQPRIAK